MKTHLFRSIQGTVTLRYFLSLVFFFWFSTLFSQISINVENQSIRSILKSIESQSNQTFFFNEGLPELDKTASLKVSGVSLEAALKKLFENTGIAYSIEGQTIVLTSKSKLPPPPASSKATLSGRVDISGSVTDESGEALPGVSVVVKGSTQGVLTNAKGVYNLKNVPANGSLVFTYVGMKSLEVAIEKQKQIDVSMSYESKEIDELVIIGYGTVKKRDLTGSVASVKMTNVNTISTASVMQALKGKIAGLSIIQNSAQPGGGLDILVRGGSGGSRYTDDTPLYVIDGVPALALDQPGSNNERLNAGTQSILNFINPNDVASVEVLRDASATAIYGARAAAGVILITTKRGETGKPLVSYSSSFALQKHSNIFDVFSLKEWMEEKNIASWDFWMFDNGVIPYGNRTLEIAMKYPKNGVAYELPYDDNDIAQAGEGTDWVNLVTRDGSIQQHNLSLRGGSSMTQYLLSLNYFDHQGIIKNSGIKRYSTRLNFDQTINRIFKAGINLTLNRVESDNTPLGEEQYEKSGLIRSAVQMGPHIKAIDENGNYPINPLLPTQPNPYSLLLVTDESRSDRLLGNFFVTIEPLKNLIFKLNAGTDLAYQTRNTYMPKATLHGGLAGGEAGISHKNSQSFLADIHGTYTFDLNKIHRFTIMAGGSAEKIVSNSHFLGNNKFLTDGFKWYNLQSGEGTRRVESSGEENQVRSVFSRINYSLMDRYLFTGTFRIDGASVFAKNHKWGYFPSLAFAWNMAEEPFMEFAKPTLDMLKLRLSYGETGNSNIRENAFFTYYAQHAWNDGTKKPQTGVFTLQLENPDLKWETTAVYNAGINLSLFNSKVDFSFDYFRRGTYDLLHPKELNSYHDVSFVMSNIGKMQGSGFEITLNTKNFSRKNFTWQSDFTLSLYENHWLEREPDWKPNIYENINDPKYPRYGYVAERILQIGDPLPEAQPNLLPGQIVLKDLNGYKRDLNGDPIFENGRFLLTGGPDGMIDEADIQLLGSYDPGPVMGLTNRFTLYDFDFSFDFNAVLGRKMADPTYLAYGASADGIAQYSYNGLRILKKRWMPENPSTTIPSSFYGWEKTGGSKGPGNWFLQDAWYIRLQSITLGYRVPIKGALQNVFSSLRFFADASNLFVFTPYTGLDPETDSYAAAYPNARTFTVGIDVKF